MTTPAHRLHPLVRAVRLECGGALHGLAHGIPPYVIEHRAGKRFREFCGRGESAFADLSGLLDYGDQVSLQRPTLYSGEMRAVCQSLLSRGHAIPWSHSSVVTDGIYTSHDTSYGYRAPGTSYEAGALARPYEGGPLYLYEAEVVAGAESPGVSGPSEGAALAWPIEVGGTVIDGGVRWRCLRPWSPKWIVEVSAAGVYAWRLEIERWRQPGDDPDDFAAGLDYIPRPTPRPEAPKRLATAASLAGAYAGAPIYFDCGWAFSASGERACNVFWRLEPYQDGRSYWHTYMYEIEIDPSPGTDGGPSQARVSALDHGWVWSDRTEHLKVPAFGQHKLLSVDLYLDQHSGFPDPIDGSPIHAWYEGEVLQRVDYWQAPSESTSGANADGTTWAMTTSGKGFLSPALSDHAKDAARDGFFPGPWEVTWATGEGNAWIGHLGGAYRGEQRERDLVYVRGGSISYTDLVVVPLNERCGIYHARQEYRAESSVTTRQVRRVATHALGQPALNDAYPVLPADAPPSCDQGYAVEVYTMLTGASWNGYTWQDMEWPTGVALEDWSYQSLGAVHELVRCQNQWVITGVEPYFFDSPQSALDAWSALSGHLITRTESATVDGRPAVRSYWTDALGEEQVGPVVAQKHMGVIAAQGTQDMLEPVGDTVIQDGAVSEYTYQARAVVGGQALDIQIDATDADGWFQFITDEIGFQRLVACADATPGGPLIYSTALSASLEPLGQRLAGPPSYPIADISSTLLAWVGNPIEP